MAGVSGHRYLTKCLEPIECNLNALNLSGLTVVEFGLGRGAITRLLRHTKAERIIAFEPFIGEIDPDILEWSNSQQPPELMINPKEFLLTPENPEGDLRSYDYSAMLGNTPFCIISNPPYAMYSRIMSLTGEYLKPESKDDFTKIGSNYKGSLLITSGNRLYSHPGYQVLAAYQEDMFDPPIGGEQKHYLIMDGFEGRIDHSELQIPAMNPLQKS